MRWLWAGAVLSLSACAELAGFGPSSARITTLALVDGSVIAAGPEGYCVETRASRAADGFAVLAGCDVIAGAGDFGRPNGFVTIQVGTAGSGLGDEIADLSDFLRTDSGRRLLSQTGDAGDIGVQGTARTAGGVTVQFRDRAAPPVEGLQRTEWRGFFDLNGRLTTVAVRGLAAAPLGTDDGQVLLESVMRAMQRANGMPESGQDI